MNTLIRKLLAVAALGLGTSLAHAGGVNWSIGINLPPIGTVISNAPVYYPPVTYYEPPPVVYRPAPVYYAPPPAVIYRPVPRYVGPPAYVADRRGPVYRGWEHRGRDGHGGWGHGGRHDRDWRGR